MVQNIIINQVKGLIKRAVARFAKEQGVSPERTALWISPVDDNLPKLSLLVDLKQAKDLEFGDLATKLESLTYKSMGFDVATDTPVWLHKFMSRVAKDKSVSIMAPKYYLTVYNNDVVAFMFLNGQKVMFNPNADDTADPLAKYKISIEYILETR
jgi:hypothetical protein